jgi:hypothetical protein
LRRGTAPEPERGTHDTAVCPPFRLFRGVGEPPRREGRTILLSAPPACGVSPPAPRASRPRPRAPVRSPPGASLAAPTWGERKHTWIAVPRRVIAAVPSGAKSRSARREHPADGPASGAVMRERMNSRLQLHTVGLRRHHDESRHNAEAPSRPACAGRTGLQSCTAPADEAPPPAPALARAGPVGEGRHRGFIAAMPRFQSPGLGLRPPAPRRSSRQTRRRTSASGHGTRPCRTRRRRPTSRFRCRDFNRPVRGSAPKHRPDPGDPRRSPPQ